MPKPPRDVGRDEHEELRGDVDDGFKLVVEAIDRFANILERYGEAIDDLQRGQDRQTRFLEDRFGKGEQPGIPRDKEED